MKVNNENRPYKKLNVMIERVKRIRKLPPILTVFTLVHTPVKEILSEIQKLWRLSKDEKSVMMEIEQRQNVEFDISYLSDYSERVQLERECLQDRVSPLVNNPDVFRSRTSLFIFNPHESTMFKKIPCHDFH